MTADPARPVRSSPSRSRATLPDLRRRRTDWPALVLPPAGAPMPAVVLDISATGAFVELDPPLPPGTQLLLQVAPPGRETLSLRARVVREGRMDKPLSNPKVEHLLVRPRGVGLRFEKLGPEPARRLREALPPPEEPIR